MNHICMIIYIFDYITVFRRYEYNTLMFHAEPRFSVNYISLVILGSKLLDAEREPSCASHLLGPVLHHGIIP